MKTNKDKESVGNKKNKKIYWIIGIIIEVIIILILIYTYFFNKPYDKIIECKIKSENNTYTTEIKNIFYLKDDITIKEKNIVNYSFQYETSYLKFLDRVKESIKESEIDGYSVKIKQNDKIYVEQIIYEYNIEKLKKNNNVEVADKTLTFKINNDENFSLTQLTEEEILKQYTELGYICNES